MTATTFVSAAALAALATWGGHQDVARIRIEPELAVVAPHGSHRFRAVVTGLEESAVTWDVRDSRGALRTRAGTITADGVYTASAQRGRYFFIRATSVEDPSLFATARVEVTDELAADVRPAVAWESIEHPRFTLRFPAALEEDGRAVAGYVEDAIESLDEEFTDRPQLGRTPLEVVVHAHSGPDAAPGTVTLTTSNAQPPRIDLLAPSLHPPDAVTMMGEPFDEVYFRRVLTHEIGTLYLVAQAAAKPVGWRFYSAPSWFVQGAQEHLGLTRSTPEARDRTAAAYLDQVRRDPERVRLVLEVENDYSDGAVLMRYFHERHGPDVLHRLLKSDQPTFEDALRTELDVEPCELVADFRDWLER